MASKNQVTLTFAGDSEKLEQAFDNVGASAKDMDTKVGTASGGLDSLGGGIDSTGSKAGDLESGFRGVTDSAAGLGKIAQGDVLGGLTDLAGGAEALATGFAGVVVPALQKTVGWLAQTRVGILAQAAASKVVSAATKVWTGIQAAFNFVMALNPIVLVIIAIVALVAIIIIAYKRSETFRRIVDGAFRAVGKVVSWLGDRFQDWWRGISKIIGFLVGAFQKIAPRLRSAFSGLFNILTFPFRTAFNFISRAWNNTVGRLRWTVPGWVPVFGGNSVSAPTLPTFHRGGIMPGAPGTEGLALLQAGERVTPAGRSGAATVIEIRSGGSRLDDALVEILARAVRVRGGNVQLVLGTSRG